MTKTIVPVTAPARTAKIDARLSPELKNRLERIALTKEVDLSDVIRDALRGYAASFEQRVAI